MGVSLDIALQVFRPDSHTAAYAHGVKPPQSVNISTMNVIVQNVAPEYRDKLLASLPETVEGEVVKSGQQ